MKKGILGLVISLLLILVSTTSSFAVEFGQDATGDPNAVKVGGASGFLYSERIVFTAAHVIESTGGLDYWEKSGVIFAPGVASSVGAQTYKAKKVLISPTYIPRDTNNQTRIDDFAIIILQESIPMKNKVVVATQEDVEFYILNRTRVQMVGYGLQNPSQREVNKGFDFSPHKLTTRMVGEDEMLQYRSINLQRIQSTQTVLKYGMLNSKENGSNCDGDSGSGYFVEKDGTRFYIAPTGGSQWGITNCYRDTTFGNGGGMTGITPTFKFLNLVRQAEAIVAEDKQKELIKAEEIRIAAELRTKQEADVKAKTEAEAKAKAEAEAKAKAALPKKKTITCAKGKKTKKVTAVNPKCPDGYKKKWLRG